MKRVIRYINVVFRQRPDFTSWGWLGCREGLRRSSGASGTTPNILRAISQLATKPANSISYNGRALAARELSTPVRCSSVIIKCGSTGIAERISRPWQHGQPNRTPNYPPGRSPHAGTLNLAPLAFLGCLGYCLRVTGDENTVARPTARAPS